MTQTGRVVLIGNPEAGRKAGLTTNAATVADAVKALRAVGIRPTITLTSGPGEATALARRAVLAGAETVIAAGGDGTVQEVARALVGSHTVLGIMPLGSVMNLAQTLGVPRDLQQAAQIIRGGRQVQMDVGEANGHYFFECAGVGISAAIFPLLHQLDAGRWGALRSLLRVLVGYTPQNLTVSVDDWRRVVCAWMISVANIPYYGAGFTLHPEAKVDDRQLEIKIFGRFSRWELFQFALQIVRGCRPRHPRLIRLRGKVIAVAASRPLPVHADTHAIATTPITFRLLPNALQVWAPSAPPR